MSGKYESTAKMGMDITDLKAGIQEARRQIKLINSEFEKSTAGMEKWSDNADGLSAKIKQLGGTLTQQEKILKSLQDQYKQVAEKQGEGSRAAQELLIKINKQEAAIRKTQAGIQKYTGQLEQLGKSAGDAANSMKNSEKAAGGLSGALGNAGKAASGKLLSGLKSLASVASGSLKKGLSAAGNAASGVLKGGLSAATQAAASLKDGLGKAASVASGALKAGFLAAKAAADVLKDGLSKIASVSAGVLKAGFSSVKSATSILKNGLGKVASAASGALKAGFSAAKTAAGALKDGLSKVASVASGALKAGFSAAKTAAGALKDGLSKIASVATGALKAGFSAAKTAAGTLKDGLSKVASVATGALKAGFSAAKTAASALKDGLSKVASVATGALKAGFSAVKTAASALKNGLSSVANVTAGALKTGFSMAKTAAGTLKTALVSVGDAARGALQKGLSTAASAAGVLENALKSVASAAAKMAAGVAAAGIAAGAAIAGAAAKANECTNVYADFEDAMLQVAATMGITQEEIAAGSDAYEKLTNAAKEAGASTRYTASEAGAALNYLALAGYDAEKAVETLPKVLDLAAAGGMDLATASDLVTDAMSALQMETEELDVFVNQMARTAQKSNTSVQQLGEAILVCAGTATSTRQEVTTLNTALGILADNGIKGAEGGTKLRNVMLSLSAPTEEAAKLLQTLGVSVYNAEGNMRQLGEITADLDKSLGKLTQEGRTNAINTIFNKTDLNAVNALLASTSGRFTELSGQIADCAGAASDMAGTMEAGLAGTARSFHSAMEGMQIEVGSIFAELKQSLMSDATEVIRSFTKDLQEAGGEWGKISEAVGRAISQAVTLVGSYLPQVAKMGMLVLKTLGSALMDNLDTLAEAGAAVVLVLFGGVVSPIPALIEATPRIL